MEKDKQNIELEYIPNIDSKILIQEVFDMVYYINMAKDKARNKNMIAFMEKHSIKQFKRVEGPVVNYKDVNEFSYRNFTGRDEQYVNGQLGCRRGHLIAIDDARSHSYKQILILEDDIESSTYYIGDLLKANIGKIQEFDMLYFGGLSEQHFRNQITLGHAYGLNEIVYDDILTMAEPSGMEIDNFYAKIIQHMSRNDRPGGQYIVKQIEPFNSIVQRHDIFQSNIMQGE